eukprot:1082226-Pyramimonas_sp.AAC.1
MDTIMAELRWHDAAGLGGVVIEDVGEGVAAEEAPRAEELGGALRDSGGAPGDDSRALWVDYD